MKETVFNQGFTLSEHTSISLQGKSWYRIFNFNTDNGWMVIKFTPWVLLIFMICWLRNSLRNKMHCTAKKFPLIFFISIRIKNNEWIPCNSILKSVFYLAVSHWVKGVFLLCKRQVNDRRVILLFNSKIMFSRL